MKRISLFAAVSMVALAALFVSCTSDSSDDNGLIVDPAESVVYEKAILDVEVGEEYSLTFTANDMWSITASESWIEFYDGSDLYASISGQAGEAITVVFKVNDKEMGFSSSTATIDIVATSISYELAEVTRAAEEASITFYALDYSTYEEYELDSSEPLAIEWSESNFAFIAKLHFVANFAWQVEGLPAWISNSASNPIATEGTADDEFSQILTTAYAGYTLDETMEATINVVCADNADISYPLTLTTPGAKGLMVVTENEGFGTFSFDADGTYGASLDGTSSDSYDFSYVVEYSDSAEAEYAITCTSDGNGGYSFSDSEWATSWVTLSQAEESLYDGSDATYSSTVEDVTYGDYLRESFRSVSVEANSGDEARAAAIFVLPASIISSYDSPADFYSSDGSLKEEVEQYLIGYVEQKGGAGGSMLEFAGEPIVDATISVMDELTWGDYYYYYSSEYTISDENMFVLEFASSGAAQINYPAGYSIDNFRTFTISGDSGDWLTVEGAETYFTVSMQASEYSEGSVVLVSNWLNVISIHCIQKQ